jgi:xanthine dehydrogenase YagS FAD-binding subunit
MTPFQYSRVQTVEEAVAAVASSGGRYLGGGTNLVDLMKGGVEQPSQLIDIKHLDLGRITRSATGETTIEACVRNSAVANHELIRNHYPLLSQAILSGATTQLRNMATTGGNLMQRTRCPYFMDTAFSSCNKRNPGTGCAAIEGINRDLAILGTSAECIATNPSDMGVALAALNATIHVQGPAGKREIAMERFHRLPGATPQIDTDLQPGELIVAVELPPSRFAGNSWYLKVRDRQSYAFALVSVAAGLEIQNGVVRSVGLALGGVAPKPWRSFAAEAVLIGQKPESKIFKRAAEVALEEAKPQRGNAFKIDLAKHAIVRALSLAAEGSVR